MEIKSNIIEEDISLTDTLEQWNGIYQTKISHDDAVRILRSKVEGRDTLDQDFKSEFLRDCRPDNVSLQYYPVVKITAKITKITWTYTDKQYQSNGYIGVVDEASGRVNVKEDVSLVSVVESKTIEGDDIDSNGIESKHIYKINKWVADGEIEEKQYVKCVPSNLSNVNVNNIQILKNKCLEEIKKQINKHAEDLLYYKGYRNIKNVIFHYDKYSDPIIYLYPVYIFKIRDLEIIVDGVGGLVEVPDMPHNELYFKKVRHNARKDIPLIINRVILLACVIGFMIYVLYKLINAEIDNYRESYVMDILVLTILINIAICFVWIIGLSIMGYFAFKKYNKEHYIEAERENKEVDKKKKAVKIFKNEMLFLFGIILLLGIIFIAILISSLILLDGVALTFEILF